MFPAVILVIFAIAGSSLAQSNPPNPTTDCGRAAQTCYFASKDLVRKKLDEFDFLGGCKAYRTMTDCFNRIPNADACNELQPFKALVTPIVDGVCGGPGQNLVTPCATQFGTCMTSLYTIEGDIRNNQGTKACPALTQFTQCNQQLAAANICSPPVLSMIQDVISAFDQDDLLDGCQGECAKLLGTCTSQLVNDITIASKTQKDFVTACGQAAQSLACVDEKAKALPCTTGNGSTVTAEMVNSIKAYVNHYCSPKSSDCITELNDCKADLVTLGPNTDVATQCNVSAKFLECTAGLACRDSVKAMIDKLRTDLETEETKANCPTVGSCADRIMVCVNNLEALKSMNTNTDKATFCGKVNTAVKCFDFVRRDPLCSKENVLVSDTETQLGVDIAPACGAAIGTCNDRMRVCAATETFVNSISKDMQQAEFCRRARVGITCFDGLRQDSTCRTTSSAASGYEDKLNKIIKPVCGGGSSASQIQVSMFFLVAIFIRTFSYFL
ncbi:uncharacterized protein LOC131928836 isoform X1 [Physella acuta]|uniref:uncharacterized protein LOC131928836 isoform X1 n=1 Tax=Physella acuta TaxID=109671 RepID=UPI0027DC4DF3|nr:uncharacterized protein LOC131928836 isoform X1 [Physella acuta]